MKTKKAVFWMFLIAQLAAGEVVFSEVMYNPAGGDEGREWIEVANTGPNEVDLSGWRLFEADSNHNLNAVGGDGVLASKGYAIIADNAEMFAAENPSHGGLLFDSAWSSLSNTGETLALKDDEGVVVAELTYNTILGGDGNNKTLEKKDLVGGENPGNWGESIDEGGTPGRENSIILRSETTTIEPGVTTTIHSAPEFPSRKSAYIAMVFAILLAISLAWKKTKK